MTLDWKTHNSVIFAASETRLYTSAPFTQAQVLTKKLDGTLSVKQTQALGFSILQQHYITLKEIYRFSIYSNNPHNRLAGLNLVQQLYEALDGTLTS